MTCPCGGEKSSNWHHRKELPVCDEARAYRNQREKKLRDRKRKPKVEVAERTCVCGGTRPVTWHRSRDIKPCRASKDARNARARSIYTRVAGKHVPWVPGTSILVPEIDPL